MIEAYDAQPGNIVAVEDVPREHTNRYGVLDIERDDPKLVKVKGVVEKPQPKDAPSTLSIIGRYILEPDVFEHLAKQGRGAGNEIQLTDALAQQIAAKRPFFGLRFEGKRFDCGDKAGFFEANLAFALARPDMRDAVQHHPFAIPLNDQVTMADGTIVGHRFDPTILREYDIRGVIDETLGEADAHALGRSFAVVLAEAGGKTIAVGRDGRLSSPAIEKALVEGLRSSGIDVVRIGLGPTPMLYFAVNTLGVDAGIMVTGSHNPPTHNGFKLMLGKKPFFAGDIQRLGKIASEGKFPRGAGTVREQYVLDDYVARILKDYDGTRPLHVAWDAGNGATGEALQKARREAAGQASAAQRADRRPLPGASPRSDRAEKSRRSCKRPWRRTAAISASPSTATATGSASSTARAVSCGAISSWC